MLVASSAFTDAADSQSELLGAPAPRRVLVGHPVQDRTDDEMRDLARGALEAVLGGLTA